MCYVPSALSVLAGSGSDCKSKICQSGPLSTSLYPVHIGGRKGCIDILEGVLGLAETEMRVLGLVETDRRGPKTC